MDYCTHYENQVRLARTDEFTFTRTKQLDQFTFTRTKQSGVILPMYFISACIIPSRIITLSAIFVYAGQMFTTKVMSYHGHRAHASIALRRRPLVSRCPTNRRVGYRPSGPVYNDTPKTVPSYHTDAHANPVVPPVFGQHQYIELGGRCMFCPLSPQSGLHQRARRPHAHKVDISTSNKSSDQSAHAWHKKNGHHDRRTHQLSPARHCSMDAHTCRRPRCFGLF